MAWERQVEGVPEERQLSELFPGGPLGTPDPGADVILSPEEHSLDVSCCLFFATLKDL